MLFGDHRLPDRFWTKVERPIGTGCWLWTAATNQVRGLGYGLLRLDGRGVVAHRLAYETLIAPVPRGLELDHLCRTRRCCNPEHAEPVTRRVNVLRGVGPTATNARKTHCKRGHELTEANVYPGRKHGRVCIACARANSRAQVAELRRARLVGERP